MRIDPKFLAGAFRMVERLMRDRGESLEEAVSGAAAAFQIPWKDLLAAWEEAHRG